MSQLVYLVIDRRILLYVGICGSNICLRLVIVVVADKITHIVLREKALELAGQLSRQSFVVSYDQRRLLHFLYDLGDGVGLARTSGPKEHLGLLPVLDAGSQIRNGLGLIPHRLKRSYYLERPFIHKLHSIQLRHHSHLVHPLLSHSNLKSPSAWFQFNCPYFTRRAAKTKQSRTKRIRCGMYLFCWTAQAGITSCRA